MEFKNILFDSSKRLAQDIANQLKENPQHMDAAFELILEEIPQLSNRMSRVIEFMDRQMPEELVKYYEIMISIIEQTSVDGIRRNFLKIFTRRHKLLRNEDDVAKLIDICFKYLNSNIYAVAVRIYAMEILFHFIRKYPDLEGEFISSVHLGYADGTPAYKSKANNLLKKLK